MPSTDPENIYGEKCARGLLFRHSVLQNAARRSQSLFEKLKKWDGQVGILRLILAATFIAFVAAYFSEWNAAQKILSILVFFFVFWILSGLHQKLQTRVQNWEALAQVYQVLLLRWNRDFKSLHELLAKNKPWHQVCADWGRENTAHPYSHDLDLRTGMYALIEGCCAPQSSQRLMMALLGAPLEEDSKKLQNDSGASGAVKWKQALLNTSVHRRLEALGHSSQLKSSYGREPQLDEAREFSVVAEELKKFPAKWFRFVFSLCAIVVWALITIPTWKSFLLSSDLDILLQGLFRFAPVPIIGLWVYAPVVNAARILFKRSHTMGVLLDVMSTAQSKQQSQQLGNLQTILGFVQFRANPLFWILIHLFLPFDSLICLLLELRSLKLLPHLSAIWRDCLDFDLQVQWARFGWENPDFHMATHSEKPEIKAVALGHPLLPYNARICNDFCIDSNTHPVVLLTGSNMAGKSTFLRALGLNLVLAQAGAPVCARSLHTSVTKVYCAIRIDDSLEESTSYFYAEVKRLKWMLDSLTADGALKPFNSLFLVDEIFRGTNNKERFLGSWHVIRALLGTQGFGIVSTHDLALSQLEASEARITNMHFREQVASSDAKLVFDYLLRAGPCPTTNALQIMRLSGLPIPSDAALQELGQKTDNLT